ncbi:MAG TPA: hypothetical protein VJI69_01635 [Bacteroidia bacterium]|nr:hypothetical protein [Bacteroidia bacterium]
MKNLIILLLLFSLSGCGVLFYGAGTLGGFDIRFFPVAKIEVVKAISDLYRNNPEYSIPEKWKQHDDWKARGYGFLDTRIFYFKNPPEEMYYVSFYGDSIKQANPHKIGIAIRAVYNDSHGWDLEKEFKRKERERVEQRFQNEIIAKLEGYIEKKSTREK